jgi:prephenate dehydrogenase
MCICRTIKRSGLKQTELVGFSDDKSTLDKASQLEIADYLTNNIVEAVEGANLVVIDVPIWNMVTTFRTISPLIDDSCTVTDTLPIKSGLMEFAQKYLTNSRCFVGGHPINISHVDLKSSGRNPFENSFYGIVTNEKTSHDSVQDVVGMVELLGAQPLFLNAEENDSYTALLKQLPALLSLALSKTATDSTSWHEISQIVGYEYEKITDLTSLNPETTADIATHNRELLSYWINQFILTLSSFQDLLDEESEKLTDSFINIREAHLQHTSKDLGEDGNVDIPSVTQTLAGMAIGQKLASHYNKFLKINSGKKWKYDKRKFDK